MLLLDLPSPPKITTELTYKGTDWEVSLCLDQHQQQTLRILTNMEESDGILSCDFFSVVVPMLDAETFKSGLGAACRALMYCAASCGQSDLEQASQLLADAPINGVSSLAAAPACSQVELKVWCCRGRPEVFDYAFQVHLSHQYTASGLLDERYRLRMTVLPSQSPEQVLHDFKSHFSTVGIFISGRTVLKPAQHTEGKRDLKLRIYSRYGYDAFRLNAHKFQSASLPSDDGQEGHQLLERVHLDCYYDTHNRHLACSHSTLRLRKVTLEDNTTVKFVLTLQSGISVNEGCQERDYACLDLSRSIAERLLNGGLQISEVGKVNNEWLQHLQSIVPEGEPLICVASLTTSRIIIPWRSFRSRLPSGREDEYPQHPQIYLDRTQCTLPHSDVLLEWYEVEVTCSSGVYAYVKVDMEAFLEGIDVEWQRSVNNKLLQYFELEDHWRRQVEKKGLPLR